MQCYAGKTRRNKEQREKVNDSLRKTCADKDNDLNFKYRDWSCDDAAFGDDGVHLYADRLSKLTTSMSLSHTRDPAHTRHRPPNHHRQAPQPSLIILCFHYLFPCAVHARTYTIFETGYPYIHIYMQSDADKRYKKYPSPQSATHAMI